MHAVIKISDKAKKQLELLNVDRDNFLRLWVESGGCSGLSYQAAIDDNAIESDHVLYEDDTLRVITDAQSVEHMQGMEIDYSDGLVKAGFRFIPMPFLPVVAAAVSRPVVRGAADESPPTTGPGPDRWRVRLLHQ